MQNALDCNYLAVDVVQQDKEARLRFQPIIASINPDLRPFRARGGKMIQYAGWADAAVPPANGLNYYREVSHTIGDPVTSTVSSWCQGMAHCSGGAGPNAFGNGSPTGP
jgi:feruloyl esterase